MTQPTQWTDERITAEAESIAATSGDWRDTRWAAQDTLRQVRDDMAQEIARLQEESRQRMIGLTNLTPGGSEFANDVNACVEYVKRERRKDWDRIKALVVERRSLQAENAALKQELARLREQGCYPMPQVASGVITAEWDTPTENAAWAHLGDNGEGVGE